MIPERLTKPPTFAGSHLLSWPSRLVATSKSSEVQQSGLPKLSLHNPWTSSFKSRPQRELLKEVVLAWLPSLGLAPSPLPIASSFKAGRSGPFPSSHTAADGPPFPYSYNLFHHQPCCFLEIFIFSPHSGCHFPMVCSEKIHSWVSF